MKPLNLNVIPILVLLLIPCHRNEAEAMEVMKQSRQTYIIHMNKSFMPHEELYDTVLKSVSDTAPMLYTYNTVIHGFSTSLTAEETALMEKQPGVLSVLHDRIYKLHTTRTPEFLGLAGNGTHTFLHHTSSINSSDVIVGVLDTGIWPELPSLADTGLGPVPSRWKGTCETAEGFNASNCNRKLIGARAFPKAYEASFGRLNDILGKSPRDDDGHGTHTSTIAAGSIVANASLFGYAPGTARGMAPQARLAMYKVCWQGICLGSDILAAMDTAVKDGVNVLSLSLGGGSPEYFEDPIAIGAFAANANGILVSCSAGNEGPSPQTLSNVAPWIITIGAGTLDRDFPTIVTLGNNQKFTGVSLFAGTPLLKPLPLIDAANASSSKVTTSNLCTTGTLDPKKVRGKIVVCHRGHNARVAKGGVVKHAGGSGMILVNTRRYGDELLADAHILPSAALGYRSGDVVLQYIHSSSDHNPTATIGQGGTHLGVQPSPIVTAFSSRGPNALTPEILKPDLIAPGVNILAGWTGEESPSGLESDKRRVDFNIISGTSMSCPHVSGLAAIVKAAHPEWSSATIRSALMTTAYSEYRDGSRIKDASTGDPATPFEFGAGHVHIGNALDPGLVYDATADDYLRFLCALHYTEDQIKRVTNRDFTCEGTESVLDLNYPSFSVVFNGSHDTEKKYMRTLTNVGTPATGKYEVSLPVETEGVDISVEPKSLSFRSMNERKSYTVTFRGSSMKFGTTRFGRIEWSDGKHVVGSPISFTWT